MVGADARAEARAGPPLPGAHVRRRVVFGQGPVADGGDRRALHAAAGGHAHDAVGVARPGVRQPVPDPLEAVFSGAVPECRAGRRDRISHAGDGVHRSGDAAGMAVALSQPPRRAGTGGNAGDAAPALSRAFRHHSVVRGNPGGRGEPAAGVLSAARNVRPMAAESVVLGERRGASGLRVRGLPRRVLCDCGAAGPAAQPASGAAVRAALGAGARRAGGRDAAGVPAKLVDPELDARDAGANSRVWRMAAAGVVRRAARIPAGRARTVPGRDGRTRRVDGGDRRGALGARLTWPRIAAIASC